FSLSKLRLSKKCNVAKKTAWHWRSFGSGPCRGRKKPQPLTGRGKLAERNETSSSALPALQHLLGDLGPNIPWSLCPCFGFCSSKNLLVEAKAPKLLI